MKLSCQKWLTGRLVTQVAPQVSWKRVMKARSNTPNSISSMSPKSTTPITASAKMHQRCKSLSPNNVFELEQKFQFHMLEVWKSRTYAGDNEKYDECIGHRNNGSRQSRNHLQTLFITSWYAKICEDQIVVLSARDRKSILNTRSAGSASVPLFCIFV